MKCDPSGSGKTNALVHMLLKPLIYYDKIYLYAKNIFQEKYHLLANELNKLAKKNKINFQLIKYMNILKIKDVDNLENKLQKVVIFDDYICDKNQDKIIKYFIQGKNKNCSVIYLSQCMKLHPTHYISLQI